MNTAPESSTEKDTGFTPGPWRAVRRQMCHVISDGYGDGNYPGYASFVEPLGLQVYGPDWKHNRAISGPDCKYIAANARLIAAAPDLFAYVQSRANDGSATAAALVAMVLAHE